MQRRLLLQAGAIVPVALATLRPRTSTAQAVGAMPRDPVAAMPRQSGADHTWLLSNAGELRCPPPPDHARTEAERAELRGLAGRRDAAVDAQIDFWAVGSPSYRWNQLAVEEARRRGLPVVIVVRQMALLNAALSDAMVATRDSQQVYRRDRPPAAEGASHQQGRAGPSYPSEHAAAAGAAAEVLGYLFSDRAAEFNSLADTAARSRLFAGANYPSDVEAGVSLGRAIGTRAVARGRADGSDVPWTGTVPTGPGRWQGTTPLLPQAATWRPWVLERPEMFRPPPPPAYDSAEKAAELAELRAVKRTQAMTATAFFWEYGAGGLRAYVLWNDLIGRKLFEHRQDGDFCQAAHAYALTTIAIADATIACWDAKYAYWAIRPSQLDPDLRPLFPPPPHPSYPAAHGTITTAAMTALAHLFPGDAVELDAIAAEAAEARIWAGIHYRSDIVAGRTLGRKVAEQVINSTKAA